MGRESPTHDFQLEIAADNERVGIGLRRNDIHTLAQAVGIGRSAVVGCATGFAFQGCQLAAGAFHATGVASVSAGDRFRL